MGGDLQSLFQSHRSLRPAPAAEVRAAGRTASAAHASRGRLCIVRRRAKSLYRSVRFRLTCWYVGILALILLVFSTGVYSALSRRIDQRVNDSLSSSVDMFSRTLTHEIEEND